MRLEDFDKAISLKDAMDDLSSILDAKSIMVNGVVLPPAHQTRLIKVIEGARDDVRAQLRHLIGDRIFEKEIIEKPVEVVDSL